MGYRAHRFEAVVAVLMRMVMVMVIRIIDNRIFAGMMGPRWSVKNEFMYSNTPENDGCVMGP
jgi:hypothetical protein